MKPLTLVAIACCGLVAVVLAQPRSTPNVPAASTTIQVPCSSDDSTTAWNASITRAINGNDKVVHLYGCTYHFYSAPVPISHGIEVQGQGMYTTYLERDYSPGHGCAATACEFISTVDIGETIKDLAIFAGRGTSGGWGLHAISSDARKGNDVTLDNVYISGYGTYSLPVYLDGRNSVQPPEGIRKVNLTNLAVFNGTWRGFECWNCVGMSWHGGGVWQGFGTTQEVLVGGPMSTVNMIAAYINGTVQYWKGSELN